MSKICKYAAQDCMGLKYKYMFKSCPKNANHKCEIVKPKAKYKTIKGWVDVFDYTVYERGGSNCVYVYHDKLAIDCFPCEIRIDRKHLGGKV